MLNDSIEINMINERSSSFFSYSQASITGWIEYNWIKTRQKRDEMNDFNQNKWKQMNSKIKMCAQWSVYTLYTTQCILLMQVSGSQLLRIEEALTKDEMMILNWIIHFVNGIWIIWYDFLSMWVRFLLLFFVFGFKSI